MLVFSLLIIFIKYEIVMEQNKKIERTGSKVLIVVFLFLSIQTYSEVNVTRGECASELLLNSIFIHLTRSSHISSTMA